MNVDSKEMDITVNDKSFRVHPTYDMYAASEDGLIIHVVRKVPLRGSSKGSNGYVKIGVRCKRGERGTVRAHRFVWECYHGIIEPGLVIDHTNDVRDDNRLVNLALMTHKQNCLKSAKNRDYSFLAKNYENRKYVRAVDCDDGSESFFNSLYAVNKHLGVNAGIVKMACEGLNYVRSGISKRDGCKYTFNYVTKEEFAKV